MIENGSEISKWTELESDIEIVSSFVILYNPPNMASKEFATSSYSFVHEISCQASMVFSPGIADITYESNTFAVGLDMQFENVGICADMLVTLEVYFNGTKEANLI